MSGKVEKLAAVLEAELSLARRLLDLAKDARAAAVAADPELLIQIVGEQEESAARLEAAEAERAALAAELAAELGLPGSGPVRLSAIAEQVPGEPAARLRRLGSRLRACAVDLREANARSREILEAALAHVDEFFALLAEAGRKPAAYGSGKARPGAAVAAAIMDRQA
jgi:flagellar biosynthesis/type III secretory pathway chaperone